VSVGQTEQAGGQTQQATGSGWSRRDFLKYGGGGAAGLGVLAWAFTGGGPAAVVKQYVRALDRGNTDKGERLRHDDWSPAFNYLGMGVDEETALSVDAATVTENTGQKATVETTITAASMTSAESTTSVIDVGLDREGGEWKIAALTYQ
jgi:hypothetical protein